MSDTSIPAVRSWPWGTGYQAHFRKPGGAWQFIRDDAGKARIYPTSEAAKDAATAIVFKFMCPPITAAPAPREDATAKALAADVVAFKQRREREHREHRKVFRGTGKGFVPVEVVKRRGA